MTITAPRSIAAAALLFLTALPAFAQNTQTQARPIAVQMYTLRNIASLEEQLKIVHDAGIHAVETVGKQNTSAGDLKQLLDKYSIKVVSTHVQLSDLRSGFDDVVAFNKVYQFAILK